MLLWRLTSIILKIEAPRPAADVGRLLFDSAARAGGFVEAETLYSALWRAALGKGAASAAHFRCGQHERMKP